MINKIYEKFITFIKEEYKFLIIYLMLFITCTYQLPFYIYTGGGILNLNDKVRVEQGYKESGSLNLAYVSEIRATIPTYLLSYVIRDWDLISVDNYKYDKSENTDDIWVREQLYLKNANDNAILNAYNLANEKITINKTSYTVLYTDKEGDTDLKVGDQILKINDIEIIDFKDISNMVSKSKIGDTFNILVLRDNKEKECYAKVKMINDKKIMGVYLITLYDYTLENKVVLNYKDSEGGSSGGLMTSLAIYNRLVESDLTKGLKIVGTGSIDEDGNIGEIGGVKYKLNGAVKNRADIFIVPNGVNYDEAINLKKEKKYNIEIVGVSTLKEAITYLENKEV